MQQAAAQGEGFREDLRPLHDARRAGAGNAAARRVLSADELAPLTRSNAVRSLASIAQTVGLIAAVADLASPHYRLAALHRLREAKGALRDAEVRDLADTFTLVFAPRCARRHPPPQGASA
jgi:hypothetical protein